MNQGRHGDNPFELNKASNFTDAEILDYWVDIMEERGGLMSVLQPNLILPVFLLGGKGSGKTHLLRYCSAPVQAARHKGSMLSAARNEGFLGVYIPAEGLNTNKFTDKEQGTVAWNAVFAMYFELWLAIALLENVERLLEQSPDEIDQTRFAVEAADLFDVDIRTEVNSVQALTRYLTAVRKRVDYAVNNSAITGRLDGVEILFSHGRLAFGIPKALADASRNLRGLKILYLIDEAENLTADQQKFLNTLVRYRKNNATFRVGARLYGIKTLETLGSGELIRHDAEYQSVALDSFLRDQQGEYAKLVSKLVMRRLQLSGFPVRATKFGEAVTSAKDELAGHLEVLDRANHWQLATLELARSIDESGRERPYFRKMQTYLQAAFNLDSAALRQVTELLRCKNYPLLEKTNVFLLYRDWPSRGEQVQLLARQIASQAEAYRTGERTEASIYARVIGHFGSDLLAQLYRDFRKRVPYAGLPALLTISQGIPRNFLTLLKYIYRRSLFAGEAPFAGGLISVEAQSAGVRDSATWFWEDAQPDGFGADVRDAIDSLAVLFRSVRYSDCPAECDLCTFSIELDGVSTTTRQVLKLAENWSYLVRLPEGARNKNDRGVSAKFQFGPMLAPKWDLSEHRRGNIELSADFANAIFDREMRDNLPVLIRNRTAAMTGPRFTVARVNDQDSLFK